MYGVLSDEQSDASTLSGSSLSIPFFVSYQILCVSVLVDMQWLKPGTSHLHMCITVHASRAHAVPARMLSPRCRTLPPASSLRSMF